MPILVKSDDVRSGRKAKGRHGPLWRLGSQWVKGKCIFSLGWGGGGGFLSFVLAFFLGGGGRAGASEGRVMSENEHQKGRFIPLCKLFKGRVTHLYQNFLMRIFVTLPSIVLTD